MPAYDDVYLDEIMETQGLLFELLPTLVQNIDMSDFISRYMKSETRAYIDMAYPYVCTKDFDMIYEFYVQREGFAPKLTDVVLDEVALNWIGQFYALYQWKYDTTSREIIEKIPLEAMYKVYPGLHDLDLDLAVTRIHNDLISRGR